MDKKFPPHHVQHVVLSMLLAGIAIAYILLGRQPGWQAYLVSGIIALFFLVSTLADWRRSSLVGSFALSVLLVAMFWKHDRPYNILVGIGLAVLSLIRARSHAKRDNNEQHQTSRSE